jgi:hypothetical protein
MASREAIAAGMAVLQQCAPTRDIDAETLRIWQTLFADDHDAAFLSACRTLARQKGRTFFPTPGEVVAAMQPVMPAIDVDRLCYLLGGLTHYTPRGVRPPNLSEVADLFGQAVADAVATVGPSRLLCQSEEDASWAKKDLRAALADAENLPASVPRVGSPPQSLPAIRAAHAATLIVAGEHHEHADAVHAMTRTVGRALSAGRTTQ